MKWKLIQNDGASGLEDQLERGGGALAEGEAGVAVEFYVGVHEVRWSVADRSALREVPSGCVSFPPTRRERSFDEVWGDPWRRFSAP